MWARHKLESCRGKGAVVKMVKRCLGWVIGSSQMSWEGEKQTTLDTFFGL